MGVSPDVAPRVFGKPCGFAPCLHHGVNGIPGYGSGKRDPKDRILRMHSVGQQDRRIYLLSQLARLGVLPAFRFLIYYGRFHTPSLIVIPAGCGATVGM